MSKRCCLVCDGEPVVEISAVTGDAVRLCRAHWAAFAREQGGMIGQVIDKFLADCGETWQERAGRWVTWLDSRGTVDELSFVRCCECGSFEHPIDGCYEYDDDEELFYCSTCAAGCRGRRTDEERGRYEAGQADE